MVSARGLRGVFLLLGVLALLAGCARGPDEAGVREAVQQQLDAALGGRVLEFERLRRAGSAALADADGRMVYFNARLKLVRDYDFTQWNSHSVTTLASLLGAGEKGVFGLKPEGNRAGDSLGAYGSAAFVRDGNHWRLVANASAATPEVGPVPVAALAATIQPRPKEEPPPTPLEEALTRLQELATRNTGPTVSARERDAILREEFDAAYRQARARLDRAADLIVIAGGPRGGAYEEVLDALRARATAAGTALNTVASGGSVDNIRLLNEDLAQFALVQNDIARQASLGRGRFAGSPQQNLRALGSLFPETVHLVAAAGSGIASVADLVGRRIGLGPRGSGTRATASAILAQNGIAPESVAAVSDAPLPEAARQLAAGEIDAFFITIHAPARELQRLAARSAVALVPIGPGRELLDDGLVPVTLPARTYAGQDGPVPTLAATALLVTRAETPRKQVDAMLRLVFESGAGGASSALSQISRRAAPAGVNIPWYDGVAAYFAAPHP
jgi:TRAP transporter TAXI family solute receptor